MTPDLLVGLAYFTSARLLAPFQTEISHELLALNKDRYLVGKIIFTSSDTECGYFNPMGKSNPPFLCGYLLVYFT